MTTPATHPTNCGGLESVRNDAKYHRFYKHVRLFPRTVIDGLRAWGMKADSLDYAALNPSYEYQSCGVEQGA
mgnify:CR=1 FL=1